MDKLSDFTRSKIGKIVIVSVLVVIILVIIGVQVVKAIKRRAIIEAEGPDAGEVAYVTDEVSGVVLREINEKGSVGDSSRLNLVGFAQLVDCGFTYDQETYVYDTVKAYFLENYPEMTRLSFSTKSFHFGGEEDDQAAYFDLVADTGEIFQAIADASQSFTKVTLIVKDESGKVLIDSAN